MFHTSALKLPLYVPLLGLIKRRGSWLSYFLGSAGPQPRQGLWAPRPEWSSMLLLVCPLPEAEDTAQCPVLAEPPSYSELQEDMAGQVGLEPTQGSCWNLGDEVGPS